MANTVDKVLSIAEAEVGYLEKKSNANLYDKIANAGSANYTKYNKEMHDIYPSVMDFPAAWCDAFVDWCFYKAYGTCNAKGLIGGDFNDYTPSSAQLYKNKNAWYTSNPKVGDQIFFKNTTRICHTGIVYKVDSTYVYTIEGNTSGASGVVANGGGVCKKKYKLNYSSIAGYGRPKYDVVVPTRNYLMKGDKGAEVKTLQKNLIFIGYSCGYAGADGDFGSGTDSAVRKFQKDNGLVVDGKYGVSSKAKLEALVAEKKKPVTPTVYTQKEFIKDVQRAIGTTPDGIVGSRTLAALITVSKSKNNRHAVVKPLQKYLNALGYNAGTPDGIAGAKFDSAAKAWAKANGCVADGEFTKGAKSWKKILGVI